MKFCATSLMSIFFVFQPSCSCGEVNLQGGDTEIDGEPTEIPVEGPGDIPSSEDMPYESSTDWRPEPSTGTLVPEGEATFYESDVGEDFSPFMGCLLPIAFSGEVYTILVGEDFSGSMDTLAAYRLAPGSGTALSTVWFDELRSGQPSICWTGEVFLASFPIQDEGNRVLTITEAGEHTRTETVGTNSGESGWWMSGDAKHIMCPTSGPFILDFGSPVDSIHLLNTDGSAAGTEIEVDLPLPIYSFSKPPCGTVGHAGACFSGLPPEDKPNMFFIDREGNVWESPSFPETAHFLRGGAIVDLGVAAAVFWVDEPDWDDHDYMGFSLLGLDGLFITPPTILDLAIEGPGEMGLNAATSGNNVLVLGPAPDERGVDSGAHLYLFDLTGNLLGDPLRMEPATDIHILCGASVFWEGDAYAILWNENGGLMYRRYRVE